MLDARLCDCELGIRDVDAVQAYPKARFAGEIDRLPALGHGLAPELEHLIFQRVVHAIRYAAA